MMKRGRIRHVSDVKHDNDAKITPTPQSNFPQCLDILSTCILNAHSLKILTINAIEKY